MPRAPRPAPPCTAWRAYLRGRLAACGLLDAKERALYTAQDLGTAQLVAFTIGVTADPQSPVLSEVDLGVRVQQLLGPDAGATDPGPGPSLPGAPAAGQVGA